MNWRDTVIDREELDTFWMNPDECDDERLAEYQAEISFKVAAKEVMDWLQQHCKGFHRGKYDGEYGNFGIYRSEIKAKLKEWGIDG